MYSIIERVKPTDRFKYFLDVIFTCPREIAIGVENTVQVTLSSQLGVVRDPLYLKKMLRLLGRNPFSLKGLVIIVECFACLIYFMWLQIWVKTGFLLLVS